MIIQQTKFMGLTHSHQQNLEETVFSDHIRGGASALVINSGQKHCLTQSRLSQAHQSKEYEQDAYDCMLRESGVWLITNRSESPV